MSIRPLIFHSSRLSQDTIFFFGTKTQYFFNRHVL